MTWILLAAIAILCAVVLLRRGRRAPQSNFGAVAPPPPQTARASRPENPAGEGAVTAAEMETMNLAARDRRQNTLTARWWSC